MQNRALSSMKMCLKKFKIELMKIIKFLLIIAVVPLLLSASLHKFYVSVTEVEFVKEKKSVQIISRIFVDDLEKAFRERYDENITLVAKNESKDVQLYMERYLKDKIEIKINGKPVNFKFIGKEYDNDIVFCYLEITGIEMIKSFEISNQLLFDTFGEQQNIVKLKINGQNKSIILISQNDKGLLNF